jgi:hypothetical protein
VRCRRARVVVVVVVVVVARVVTIRVVPRRRRVARATAPASPPTRARAHRSIIARPVVARASSLPLAR